MATIYKRKDVSNHISWRVQFRRKGYPTFCLSFSSKKEAMEWAKEHEPLYLKQPSKYFKNIDFISLFNNRQREIKRMEED